MKIKKEVQRCTLRVFDLEHRRTPTVPELGGPGRYDTLRRVIRFSVNVQRAKPRWIYCIWTPAKNTLIVLYGRRAQMFVSH